MANGSKGDLNILLQARLNLTKKAVDITKKDIATLEEMLKDRPVKLNVKLTASVKDLRKQVGELSKKLETIPVRVKVELDAGSIDTKDLEKTINERTKNKPPKVSGGVFGVDSKEVDEQRKAVENFAKTIEDAKKRIQGDKRFGDGVFSTFEIRNAENDLKSFILQLQKASGVVYKFRHTMNEETKDFDLIDIQALNNAEQMIHKTSKQIRGLKREIDNLGGAGAGLKKSLSKDSYTQDEVDLLRHQLKLIKDRISMDTKENDLLRKRAKLLKDISEMENNSKTRVSKSELGTMKNTALQIGSEEDYKNAKMFYDDLVKQNKVLVSDEKESQRMLKERLKLSRQLKHMEDGTSYSTVSPSTFQNARHAIRGIQDAESLQKALEKIDDIKSFKTLAKDSRDWEVSMDKLRDKLGRLFQASKISATEFRQTLRDLEKSPHKTVEDVQKEIDEADRKIYKMKHDLRKAQMGENVKLTGAQTGELKSLIKAGDNKAIDEFMKKVYGSKFEIKSLEEAVNSSGQKILKWSGVLQTGKKDIQALGGEIVKATGQMTQSTDKWVNNANKHLNAFEQFKIAMERVPVWMASMTAFYGTIHAFQDAIGVIVEVDTQLTEMKRVMDEDTNFEVMLEGAIETANRFGQTITDVNKALIGFSRQGFSMQESMALTESAIVASNVSDLTAEEAMSDLTSAMVQFKIEAEDSMSVIDKLNEVN